MKSAQSNAPVDTAEAIIASAVALVFDLERVINDHQKDPEVMRAAKVALARITTDTKFLVGEVDRHIIAICGKKGEKKTKSGWTLRAIGGFKETIDQEGARNAYAKILAQHSFEAESGEVILSVPHARKIVDTVLALVQSTKPAKQALKAHNIDPDFIFLRQPVETPKVELVEPPEKAEKVSHRNLKMVRGGDAA